MPPCWVGSGVLFLKGDALKSGSRHLFGKLLHNDYVLKPERLGKAA